MEEVKKKVENSIKILEGMKDELDCAIKNASTFFTTLKEKDANQAYHHLLILKKEIKKAFSLFSTALDDYELKLLEE